MPRRKAVSLYDLSRGKKRLYTLWKVQGGYQSLFPCLGEGTHVITLRLVLRYPMSKCREQKRRARLNLRAPKRKEARGWKNKIKNKYKNQEIFSLSPRLSQFYRVEILARTSVFHIPLLIPEEEEGLLSSGISYFIPCHLVDFTVANNLNLDNKQFKITTYAWK